MNEREKPRCFVGPGDYSTRLQQYGEDPETCAHQYLQQFIRGFRPERLLPNKDLWLHIQEDGRLLVRAGKTGEEIIDLSETDRYIFSFLCFLQVEEFWNAVGNGYGFPSQPIFIRDFSGCLCEGVDFTELLTRAKAVSNQITVF